MANSKLETKIISTHHVKPSFPTPRHLQRYKLSMLDQVVPPMLVPIVLYYPATTSNNHPMIINHLKDSLSLILTRFYPLAGRINEDSLSVDCNDQGVPFVVAEIINGQKLSDLLQNPMIPAAAGLSRKLLPCEVTWNAEPGTGSTVAMIQLTRFDCGGFTIGVVFWHKIADAATIGHFLKSWAQVSRGSGKEPICPNYVAPLLFPQNQEIQAPGSLGSILKKGKSITRRYVLDAHAISTLKSSLLMSNNNINRPSRVEVVSALIWRCFMAASLANGKSESVLTHAVNLRSRAQPAFPSDCFGNFPGLSAASCPNDQLEISTNDHQIIFVDLVRKLREAIRKIDNDFVNRMLGDEGYLGYQENLGRVWGEIPQVADLLSISSWCGFGFYEVDFGWGKPIWITRCDDGNEDEESAFLNVVWLMDSTCRFGDHAGVEAWVTLDEKYMQIFDTSVDEYLSTTSIAAYRDPTPLIN